MKVKLNIQHVRPSGLELAEKVVSIQRVTKVTKGGRTFGFSAIVVVGDEKSIVGIGLGKSKDVATAIQKGIESAKKNLVKLPIYNGTIPHEQEAKFKGASVLIGRSIWGQAKKEFSQVKNSNTKENMTKEFINYYGMGWYRFNIFNKIIHTLLIHMIK